MAEQYYKLYFDDQGSLLNPTEQETIITSLLDTAKPVTDLWILSHGWNTDRKGADATYNTWVGRMRERICQEIIDTSYYPVFVGIYWPSMPWSDNLTRDGRFPQSVPITSMLPSLDPGEFEFEEAEETMNDYAGEFALGEEEATFEAGGYESTHATATSNSFNQPVDKAHFIEVYRDVMDPRGEHANHYEQDFSHLYDLLFQFQQPSTEQIEEFVRILHHYKVEDPHSDPFENIDLLNAPERVITQLKAELESHSTAFERFGPDFGNILLSLLRVFTFWTMKGRAAVVGQNGVAAFLQDVKNTLQLHHRKIRLHLLGHSFGAKLVSATVFALANAPHIEPPVVDTLILLLGAFSQFSFSSNIPIANGGTGYYASLIVQQFVANPIVAVYSQYDLANKAWYPLGMRLADPSTVYEWGGPHDRFGAIGANGIQGLEPTRSHLLEMLPLDTPYHWSDLSKISCLNIDGQHFINKDKDKWPFGAHGDTDRPEIFHLALAISRR